MEVSSTELLDATMMPPRTSVTVEEKVDLVVRLLADLVRSA